MTGLTIFAYIIIGFGVGINAVSYMPIGLRDTAGARLVSSYFIAVFWPIYIFAIVVYSIAIWVKTRKASNS